jgi:hypothetical protein
LLDEADTGGLELARDLDRFVGGEGLVRVHPKVGVGGLRHRPDLLKVLLAPHLYLQDGESCELLRLPEDGLGISYR